VPLEPQEGLEPLDLLVSKDLKALPVILVLARKVCQVLRVYKECRVLQDLQALVPPTLFVQTFAIMIASLWSFSRSTALAERVIASVTIHTLAHPMTSSAVTRAMACSAGADQTETHPSMEHTVKMSTSVMMTTEVANIIATTRLEATAAAVRRDIIVAWTSISVLT